MEDMGRKFLAAVEALTPKIGDKVYLKSNGHFLGRVKRIGFGYVDCGSIINEYRVFDEEYYIKKD